MLKTHDGRCRRTFAATIAALQEFSQAPPRRCYKRVGTPFFRRAGGAPADTKGWTNFS